MSKLPIDGNPAGWGDSGFRVDCLADSTDDHAAGFEPRFRLAWDERGLLGLFVVTDSTPSEAGDAALYNGDSVELMLAPSVGADDSVLVIVSPGRDAAHPVIRKQLIDNRRSKEMKPINALVARSIFKDGYAVSILIPWENLGIQPGQGESIAVGACVNDGKPKGNRFESCWYPAIGLSDPHHAFTVNLTDHASPPMRVAVWGGYSHLRSTDVRITASVEAGSNFVAAWPGLDAIHGTLARAGQHWLANVHLPLPPINDTDPGLQITVGSEAAPIFRPGSIARARHDVLASADVDFAPVVFSGESFPPCDLKHPKVVVDAVGPYHIHTQFFNAGFEPVTTAQKPGRYGAIVEVKADSGDTLWRYITLFRTQEKVDWGRQGMAAATTLPAEVGIDPEVASQQAKSFGELAKEHFSHVMNRDNDAAMYLSWMSELKPDASANGSWDRAAIADQKWWFTLRQKLTLPLYQTLVQKPADYDQDPARRWPLILFLHGSGERGDQLKDLYRAGLPAWVQRHKEFPFVVVSPQCPMGEIFNVWEVNAVLDQALKDYRIDERRIYLTGLSMGGYGTWMTASTFPDRFAAVVPISGAAEPDDILDLKDVPLWVFHGAKDFNVPIDRDNRSVAALKAIGSQVKYTVYPDLAHDCWTRTYANQELYQWLLQHQRGG